MALDLNHPDLLAVERQLCSSSTPIIFFVGAGLSRQSGFPLWHELLLSLVEFGRTIGRISDTNAQLAYQLIEQRQYLECGTVLRQQLGERLIERLHDIFATPIKDFGPYKYLVRIPCAGYITTNYDALIESAYTRFTTVPMAPILPQMTKMLGSIREREPFLLKLHGDAKARTFVLSADDYASLKTDTRLQRFLYTIFYHYKIVFLGYGLSDSDVLSPLSLLSDDYGGSSHRHLAIMPDSIDDPLRRRLEDQYGINVVLYSSRDGRVDVERVLLKWLGAREDATNEPLILTQPRDCTDLLTKHTPVIAKYMKNAAQLAASWLQAMEPNWGIAPNTTFRAANVAEVLIAFKTAKHVLSRSIDFNQAVNALLSFRNSNGGILSESFGTATVHTTALSTYALSLHEHISPHVVQACQDNCDWLLSHIQPLTGGWGTFGRSKQTRIVPSLWAYIALYKADRFPADAWRNFAQKLSALPSIGLTFDDKGSSASAAAWTLWLLAFLEQKAARTQVEEALLAKCLKQLSRQKEEPFLSESEGFPIDESGPVAKQGVWVRWIHPSAAAVAIGTVPWLATRAESWEILGSAVSFLMQQSNQGIDGHLRDSTIEPDGTVGFVFPTVYGLWAFCDVLQYISGSLIDKIGLLTIRDGKVLLLRKRGGALLIVPGGRREDGENEAEALRREISEELQTRPTRIRPWKVFEDTAAFEKGATVRITAFLGDLEGEPRPAAEISGMVWAGADYPLDLLSPIVRNKIFPELIKARIIK